MLVGITKTKRLGLAVSVLSTVENTRQVTECVALHCSDKCKARIMAENIYDFLCMYGLTKVGMISIVEERTMLQTMNASVHHVQEVINVIESQLKTHLILYSPADLNHAGEVLRRPRIS